MSTAEVRLLALDDVEEGQILTQDLQASGGAVLLLKGTVLTPKLLEMLRSRGYTELWVESPQDQLSLDEIRARLDAAFQHSESTPVMIQLRALLERFHSGASRRG